MLRSSAMPRSATVRRPHRRPGLPAVLVSTFIALQLVHGAPPAIAAERDDLPASLLEAQRMGLHPTPLLARIQPSVERILARIERVAPAEAVARGEVRP